MSDAQSPQPQAAVGTPNASAGPDGMGSPPQQHMNAGSPMMYSQQQPGGNAGAISPAQGMQMPIGGMGEEPRRAHLYIGNLSPRVTEFMLTEIFAVAGTVTSAKIIPDRHFQHGGINYGFVEYADLRSAEQALATLNGRKIFDTEIRVNWAHQTQQAPTGFGGSGSAGLVNQGGEQGQYHVFVGDLSAEVNDEVLAKAFGAFGTLTEARVMWDMNSGKSRGYGFLAFKDKADAEQAISTMNGEWLGARAIRVNWANQKTQTGGGMSRPTAAGGNQQGPLDYQTVLAQTPAYNTTVYVGNLIPYSTQADLIPLFQGYGYIVEIRMQADRGFAFVKLDTHENAALAICNLQNQLVHGRPVKCSWGKDRESTGGAPGAAATAIPQQQQQQPGAMAMGGMMGAYPGMQMYGMPQAQYNQYAAYPGYGYPAAAAASPIATTPASAAPSAQQQWGAQDPAAAAAAYYQQQAGNQWGSYYGGQAGAGQAQQGQQGQQR